VNNAFQVPNSQTTSILPFGFFFSQNSFFPQASTRTLFQSGLISQVNTASATTTPATQTTSTSTVTPSLVTPVSPTIPALTPFNAFSPVIPNAFGLPVSSAPVATSTNPTPGFSTNQLFSSGNSAIQQNGVTDTLLTSLNPQRIAPISVLTSQSATPGFGVFNTVASNFNTQTVGFNSQTVGFNTPATSSNTP